jgi:23S rRNA (uridine2552-2'-O)-methyltransferase
MTRWYQEKKRDHFYKEAKESGYRARSAYKLKQINKKYHVISQNDCVLDLGAAPGGWSQVIQEIVGSNGCIIAVDRDQMTPLDGVFIIQGDIAQPSTIEEIEKILKRSLIDTILSDMSPDISGVYSVDQARSVWLCNQALHLCERFLKPQGRFVCKLFEGEDTSTFLSHLRTRFSRIHRFSPQASRKSSSEIYIIAQGFQGKQQKQSFESP